MKCLHIACFVTLFFLCACVQASDLSREREYATALATAPRFGDIVNLGEGNTAFVAIYTQTEQLKNRGTVILLHEIGSSPDKDPVIYHLRRQLPTYHWDALALQMPLREAGAAPSDYYALFNEAQARILEAVRHLALKGTETLVIVGHGLGAQMAVYAQANAPMHEIKALVAIGLNVPDSESETAQILKFIKQLSIPLLDIYTRRDSPKLISCARDKRLAARNNNAYRQIKLKQFIPYVNNPKPLVQHINSWLTRVTRQD